MAATILILGNYRQTITVIRSLGRAGHRIIVGRDGDASFVEYSRYVSEVWPHPPVHEEESFVKALQEYLVSRRERGEAMNLFPVGESELHLLCSRFEELKSLARIISASPAVVLQCFDKNRVYERASELGLPVPRSLSFRSSKEWTEAARETGYPVVLKRRDSSRLIRGAKALILQSEKELSDFLVSGEPELENILLQKWVGGFRHNLHFASTNGDVFVLFQQKVLRTDAMDGTGYGVEGVSVSINPTVAEYCRRLVRDLGYRGVGCIQFLISESKAEPDPVPWFLEINPRLDATCALPYYCGVDFPRIALECSRPEGARVRSSLLSQPEYPSGKTLYWLYGDFFALLHSVRVRELGLFGSASRIFRLVSRSLFSSFHVSWNRLDPKPSLYLLAFEGPRNLRRAFAVRRYRRKRSAGH